MFVIEINNYAPRKEFNKFHNDMALKYLHNIKMSCSAYIETYDNNEPDLVNEDFAVRDSMANCRYTANGAFMCQKPTGPMTDWGASSKREAFKNNKPKPELYDWGDKNSPCATQYTVEGPCKKGSLTYYNPSTNKCAFICNNPDKTQQIPKGMKFRTAHVPATMEYQCSLKNGEGRGTNYSGGRFDLENNSFINECDTFRIVSKW